MAKLKPWYQVVTPREDLRENRPLDASEFAVHLDHIRTGRTTVSKDYSDPARFFERTYLTGSLLELATHVVRRLNGIQVETSAVFNMATQFGGGKSHSLTTLYHLARGGDQAKTWKGVESILRKADVGTIPKADVAAFVGTEFDVLKGRTGDGEPTRKTPWGEIAWQLGGQKSFQEVAQHDERGIAPAGDVIRKMLPSGPTVILMDELLNYVSSGRKAGMRDQFFNFLQNLCEESRARNNMALVVSIPASELEMNPDDQRDHDSLKKLCDRLGKAILMSADREMAEIIRRRLFEWSGMPEEGRKTSAAYAEWAIEHAPELAGFDKDSAYELFQSSYPFHPSVLSVFERKWQSLPRFQRTRGVLRLLALWVSQNYQEEHRKSSKEPLLTLGLAPLDNSMFRAALFEQLGSGELEIPVTTDIVGKSDAHGVRLDKEATDAVKQAQLHRKVATTIFFESNGGMSAARHEATTPEIKTSVGGPEMNLVDVEQVLEGLASNCFYLNWERNRYRFGLSPNLNQVLVTRRGAVQDKEIDDRIREQTQKLFDKNSTEVCKQLDRKYWPKRSNDVPSRAVLSLVVLSLDTPGGDKGTGDLMEAIVRDCGTSGRTFKSAIIFAAPDATENIREAARSALAWEDIDEDEDTKKRVDEGQLKLLTRNLSHARRDLDEAIFRAYRHIYLLGKDNKLRHVDLGQITSSSAASIVELILRELIRNDEITEGVGVNKLIKYWPPALVEWSTKAARDAFYSSPQLPRLLNPDAIRRTISDGVAAGQLGLATKDAGGGGRLKLQKLRESLIDVDVDISDDVFILKADDAQKLKEPPRLASLVVLPDNVVVTVGDQVGFECSAIDQYGQSFDTPPLIWSATGGTITATGMFAAGDGTGLFTIQARGGAIEGVTEVRIQAKRPDGGPSPGGVQHPPGKRLLRWRGTIPPQKWMNFYTKILSRFSSSPDLRLEVSFDVLLDSEQAKGRLEESRNGLKELGLDDGIDLT